VFCKVLGKSLNDLHSLRESIDDQGAVPNLGPRLDSIFNNVRIAYIFDAGAWRSDSCVRTLTIVCRLEKSLNGTRLHQKIRQLTI
jgi:hypothetical protein